MPTAKPLLQREGSIDELLDPCLKRGSYSSSQAARMVRAAAACLNNEESGRPSINKIIAILRGDERCTKNRSILLENGCVGCYPQLHDVQSAKSDMKSHLALAMMGVMELEEDDIYSR
ncbi:protein kinase STUNTED-like [Tasmannia lanceolata]|uniref:protein kinase STUNTED-like n=1 Tax=Tasmannia lanceolata TaxID=3420 RepID=UPI004064B449